MTRQWMSTIADFQRGSYRKSDIVDIMDGVEASPETTDGTARAATAAIGRAIRCLRRSRSLRQEELADLAGVSRAALIGVENGSQDPRLSTVAKLLAPLGHTITVCEGSPSAAQIAGGEHAGRQVSAHV